MAFAICCGVEMTTPEALREHRKRFHTAPAASEGGGGTRPEHVCKPSCHNPCLLDDDKASPELEKAIREVYASRPERELPVASVEGQRTGEPIIGPHGANRGDWIYEDELPMGYPYEEMYPYSILDGVRLFPADPKKFASVPSVEGMGAREPDVKPVIAAFANFVHGCFIAGEPGDLNEYGKTHNNALAIVIGEILDPQDNAPLIEALDAYARSLRGAGGEPDATTIAKAIAYWRDRALAAEAENLRLKLLSDHVECYWDLEDPDCSVESPETYASENGLKVGDEFTLQAAQYWPVQFVVKKTFADEETDNDWEVEEVGKKRADFPDYITIKARAEASESREQAMREELATMKLRAESAEAIARMHGANIGSATP